MILVYSIHLKTGREQCVNSVYEAEEDAVRKIAQNYRIDAELGQLGEYYYFMKKR